MATEVTEKQKYYGIRWADPYQRKDGKELQSFSTCVIDGYGWRVSPAGRPYCIGRVGILPDGTTKTIADKSPNSAETISSVVKEPDPKIGKGKTTNANNTKCKNNNFGSARGRPKKDFPVDLINQLFQEKVSMKEISRKTGVPFSSVHRILSGQRVLV